MIHIIFFSTEESGLEKIITFVTILVSTQKFFLHELKGNAVRIGNSTRCCVSLPKEAIMFLNSIATVPAEAGWEGIGNRDKSEDLPRKYFHYVAFGTKADDDCLKTIDIFFNPDSCK